MDIKLCSKCGIKKPLSEFHKDRYRLSGHISACKECYKVYRQQSYVKERKKLYQQSLKMKEWNAEYRKRPEVIERTKLWEKEHKEHRAEYNKRTEVVARKREYRRKHPEMYKGGGRSGGIKKRAWGRMKAEYNWICPRCKQSEPFLGQYWVWLTQDHIIARVNGGKKYSKNNIQPLCWRCNCIVKGGSNIYYPPVKLIAYRQ